MVVFPKPLVAIAAVLCSGNGVCFSVGVPSSSASAGSGNIYFQITAPTSAQWVAMGPGTDMADSYMFIMYEDGKGNVTLSPRQGTRHVPPRLDTSASAAKLTLLAGSGVSSDGRTMTANVACANCESLAGGGKLSITDTKSNWIAAWKSGPSFSTTSLSQQLSVHDDTVEFQLDLTKATLSSDKNPFFHSAVSDPDSDSGSSGGGVTVTSDNKENNAIMLAHGVIMAIVVVILYPFGSLLMPLLGKWRVHAAFQMLGFILMWAGFGLGVRSALVGKMLFKQGHTILGTVVVCAFLLQPVLGYLHHRYYVNHESRGLVSYAHIWFGRVMMLLGVINGGLGLQLASSSNTFVITYSVVAAVMFLFYIFIKSARKAFSAVSRLATRNAVQIPMRTFIAPTVSRRADFVQELYLKELKAHKAAPIKDSDAIGQVATFSEPKTPASPEEADLASSLKEYESMAVEVEGQEGADAGKPPAAVEDWLVDEEEDEVANKH
ncbi:hypothetical protein QBC33DRAFT_577423 [Phialemonium atrogriseum]|uniref:DOMON domain-containing protein n=1 Tax=Phialemonium atrogriseum TaxID=1093897 RepID=A0AAJ0FI33_9PEZI|nr:uncharacterized protein QBC33DRAFT_577423 [Phialemonium atrogriseum]KAK1768357.1 hypothetical protein QBC33DRAFT_577423 [Phialemonium atrogriseum]